jgi:hypothetical protein
MSGKAAALGGRLMQPVADQMLKQFVANFAARLATLQAQQAATSSSDAEVASTTPQNDVPHSELNGLALVWAVVRDWLRSLFSRKAA